MLNIWPIYLLYMYHQFHYPRFVGFIWPAPHFECLGYTGICVNLFCQKSASNYEETSIPPGESKTSGMENSGPPTRYDLIPLRYGLRTSKSRRMSILPGRCQLSRGWLGGWEEMVVTPHYQVGSCNTCWVLGGKTVKPDKRWGIRWYRLMIIVQLLHVVGLRKLRKHVRVCWPE